MINTNKFKGFLKQTIIFLSIFLVLNWLITTFIAPKNAPVTDANGSVIFETTKDEYSRVQKVNLKITNNTTKDVIIPNECPNEPLNVYRYEKNEWIEKTASPEMDCTETSDITVKPGKKINIVYDNWNYAIFSSTGRFKISMNTEIDGEIKTIESPEFTIVKEGVLKQLWMGALYKPIYNGLIYLTKTIPTHPLGWAIIILTIIIRLILLIPSQKALSSQKKMQELQPKLERIKEKYKGDQQKISMETMALWKEAKVNPMGSCLPILLQFPFLIAIFYVIRDGLNPDNAHLLYSQYTNFTLHDISTQFFGLDLTKANAYVLPLIIGGLQFVQMKLSMVKPIKKDKDKSEKKNEMAMAQNMMVYFMPVMIAVFTATMPAGVGIYWGASTLFGIIQQIYVNKAPTQSNSDTKVRVINT